MHWLSQRERIRTLQLLPKKWNVHYNNYLKEDTTTLKQIVAKYIEKDNFAVELNLFPDKLPLDVEEYTIWVRNKETSQEKLLTS